MQRQAPETLAFTLRGFSPRELVAEAEQRCSSHFGACSFRLEECSCIPCVCSIGGRVRLYEAHVVARPSATAAA
jgi:hypothetical protein